ncbi:MAG: HAD hydrolase-like protein [Nanoarchaeota archaeon]|nr:HAD hydrolase-like protein [Nanoarchaeota archaeon]
MIKLVTWDFNGTILADTDACMDAGNHMMRTFGGRPLSRREYAKRFTFPSLEFYCAQGCDREAIHTPGSAKVFHDFYETRASQCRTRKGAREILKWLQDQNAKSIILSNHVTDAIMKQLERLGLSYYIPEILGNGDLNATQVGHNKIHRMELYLERTGYPPEESLIVGDSPEDIGIGRKFGMKTVAITDGYFATSRLRASNPDYLIGSLLEVRGIVERLNSSPAS